MKLPATNNEAILIYWNTSRTTYFLKKKKKIQGEDICKSNTDSTKSQLSSMSIILGDIVIIYDIISRKKVLTDC